MRNSPPGLLQWEHDVDVYVPASDAARLRLALHHDCAREPNLRCGRPRRLPLPKSAALYRACVSATAGPRSPRHREPTRHVWTRAGCAGTCRCATPTSRVAAAAASGSRSCTAAGGVNSMCSCSRRRTR
eukprot:4932628-Prymnesium_polylepis.1